MDQYLEKELETRRSSPPGFLPSVAAPEPAVATSPASEFSALQSGIGNAAMVGAASNGSHGVSSNTPQFQSTLGNSAMQQFGDLTHAEAPPFARVEQNLVPAIDNRPVAATEAHRPTATAGTIAELASRENISSASIGPESSDESETQATDQTDKPLPRETVLETAIPEEAAPVTERVLAPDESTDNPGHRMIQGEVAEAAAAPGVKANIREGEPIVLTPSDTAVEPTAAAPPAPPSPETSEEPELLESGETPTPDVREPLSPEAPGPREIAPDLVNALPQSLASAVTAAGPPAEVAAAPAAVAVPAGETAATGEATTVSEGGTSEATVGEAGGAETEATGAAEGGEPEGPPDSEAAEVQTPERELTFEEFQTVLEAGQTPEQDRAVLQDRLTQLRVVADGEKAAIVAEAETQKAQIMAEAESQIAAVQETMQNQIAAVREVFAAARADLLNQVESNKAAVVAQVEEEVARVQSETEARVEAIQEQLTQRQTDLTAFAEEQRQQPPIIAEEETRRAHAELETAARESEQAGEAEASRYPGDEEPKPDQRAAAREVATESAADIRDKKPAIAEDLQSRTEDFSGQYMEYAETVNAQIEEAGATLIPALQESATAAVASLEQSKEATLLGIDARLQSDLPALDAGEAASFAQLQAAGDTAISQIQSGANQAAGEIDVAAAALLSEVDRHVEATAATVSQVEYPFLPGLIDVVEGAQMTVMNTSSNGRAQIVASASTAGQIFAEVATSFSSQAGGVVANAQASAGATQEQASQAIQQTVQSRSEQGQQIISAVTARQEGLIAQVLAEVDQAIAKARQEIQGINNDFRSELRTATDESIEEAKKPRTDPVEDRAHAAAAEAAEAWYWGLLRAIGQIVVGLIILVVVALVVAAIAAAFGFILTAWTAIMIAGAILLAVGFVMALIHRSSQAELANSHPLTIVGYALIDTIGVTGMIEGVTGEDIVTGQELSDAEQTERGVLGVVTFVGLIFGVRGAIKGPPGGVYWRPGRLGRFAGLGELFTIRGWTRIWQGPKEVLVELYTGLRQGVRNAKEWFNKRFGKEPVAPAEPGPGARPRRGADESQQDYMKRLREFEKAQKAQRQYEDFFDEQIRKAKSEIRDPDNQAWWDDPARTARERRLAYDVAHKGLITDKGISEARLGLLAERQGVVEGPIRRSQGLAEEFVDSRGQGWDVKSGRAGPETFADDLILGENVLVDRAGLSEPQFRTLMQQVADVLNARGHGNIVPDLPSRVRPIPPFANIPPPLIVPTPSEREEE